ncbi:tyrosine-protein phosphatase [Flagellimonas sp. 2504JD4-2]
MFTFFQKKRFLADYLHGLVDMHNHILPGIDDGAKSVEESMELVRAFGNLGVKNFVCTPHIMHNYYPNTPEVIKNAHNALKTELENSELGDISMDIAAEHMIDDNFENILENGGIMPLKQDYLLIEMSYLQQSINFNKAIKQISKQRLFPILAHPERYGYFHNKPNVYSDLKSRGILFQINMLSLVPDIYGKEVQKTAQKLLEDGLVNFIASDVHNMRQLSSIKEMRISNKMLNLLLPVIENTIRTFY